MLLSRAEILSLEDTDYKEVEVPKWGTLRIKTLSIEEQISFEKMNKDKKTDSEIMFCLLSLCCVDKEGAQLFTKEDFSVLNKKSAISILSLFKSCLDLNSMNVNDLDVKAKNS